MVRITVPAPRVFWIITLVGLLVYACFFLFESFLMIRYPYQVSYGEGFILHQAVQLSRGAPVYNDIAQYPFLVGNYPPVYPLLGALMVRVFGVSFGPGRFISCLAVLVSSVLLYAVLRHKERSSSRTIIPFIGALLLLASPYIFYYFPLYRVDALALMLSLVGMYIVYTQDDARVLWAIPCFILALYTKQSYIAAPLAACIYLFMKNKKNAVRFVGVLGLTYGALFLLLQHFTRGQFYLHTIVYNANIFSIVEAVKMYVTALQIHAVLFFFSCAYVVYSCTTRKVSLFTLYFIISALVAFSAGKVGSNVNYFGELVASSCIMVGMFLQEYAIAEKGFTSAIAAVGLIVQCVLFGHMPYVTGHTPTRADQHAALEVSQMITHESGPVLSEDSGLLVVNGMSVLFQPFEFTQLVGQGLWDQTLFVRDIREKKFSLVILTFDIHDNVDPERLTPEMAEALNMCYYLEQRVGKYFLYRPILHARD